MTRKWNNGLGLRINNTHTTHVGKERIEQFTDKGNWERTLYVHEDVMGNTRYYTKANGQSFAELTYDAWGMPVSPNKLLNNDHGNYVFATFTGHIYDTTLDIYFAEARFYDANNRTWLAMDPVKDGLNWYQYCYSNPTTYFDPLGLWGTTTGSKQATLSGSNTSTGTSSYIWGLIASIGGNIGEAYLFPYALVLEATTGVHALSLVNSGRQGTEDWIRKNFSTSDRSFYQGALAGDEIVQIFGKLVVVQGGLQALGGISVAFGAGGATIGSGGALALPGGIAIAVDTVVVAQGVQTAVAGGILYSVASKNSFDHQDKLNKVNGESKFKWGNSKSTPTYGHTFSEHGQKRTAQQLIDRANSFQNTHQVGQWLDDQKAADFLADAVKQHPGEDIFDVELPADVKGRVFLPDGTELEADMAKIVLRQDGGIRTAFPYSSLYATD